MHAPSDWERILCETSIRSVDYHAELASTNDHALQQVDLGAPELPRLVITSRQTQGRGRQGNSWWSADGALTFSVVIDLARWNLPTDQIPRIALWTGLGIRDAVAEFIPQSAVRLKWPNDIFVEHCKVCGILVEASSRLPGRVVVGVGINVNNRVADRALDWVNPATSLAETSGVDLPLVDLLVRVLQGMDEAWRIWAEGRCGIRELWEPHCLLQGQMVTCQSGRLIHEGPCYGIDDQGCLLVESQGVIQRILGGTVTRIRSGTK